MEGYVHFDLTFVKFSLLQFHLVACINLKVAFILEELGQFIASFPPFNSSFPVMLN